VSSTYDHNVIGAGPAGLTAALTLARSGATVRVYERAEIVGHRFKGDFQGLENWSSSTDALTRLGDLGVEATFANRPFHEVTFYDSKLRPSLARSIEPLFYLVRRGPGDDSLDRALAEQAADAGVEVLLGTAAVKARRGDIVAIGPRYADGVVSGYIFETNLEDQAHCVVSEDLAPAGYSYLVIWDGRATLATCMFRRHEDWQQARSRTVETFTSLVAGLDLDGARTFSGFGSVFGEARFSDEAGRLFVGEAAGLQDPEWGFGMWYAMESGFLAARSLIEGFDYQAAGCDMFESRREAAFFNRLLYERLPASVVSSQLRRGAESSDPRGRLRRRWASNTLKSAIARAAMPRFSRTRFHDRDRACHSVTCDCVWCTHGQMCEDHDDRSDPFEAVRACGNNLSAKQRLHT
jgi:flavin-dependent dehydrogenase